MLRGAKCINLENPRGESASEDWIVTAKKGGEAMVNRSSEKENPFGKDPVGPTGWVSLRAWGPKGAAPHGA